MSADREIAVLGFGMHPWGKWGRNFVEYGVAGFHCQTTYSWSSSA